MIVGRSLAYLADQRRFEAKMERMKQMSAQPEVAKPNVPPPAAIIAVTLSQIMRAQADAASAQGEMRSAFSRAEAKGMNLAAVKRALKVKKSGKADEFVAEMSETIRILGILGIGLQKSQLDLFEVSSGLAPIEEKAYEDGLRAGRFGEPEDVNPHGLETPTGQKWLEGHRVGAEERRLVMAMKEEDDEPSAEVLSAEEAGRQTDIEDDEPFGGPWPDDRDITDRRTAAGA